MLFTRCQMFPGFLGRKVQRQQTIDSRSLGLRGIRITALGKDQIVVGIKNDRHLAELTNRPYQGKHPRRGHAAFQRALRCQLIGHAVGQRIRKRHTELQHIDPGIEYRAAGSQRGLKIRIPGTQVRNKDRRLSSRAVAKAVAIREVLIAAMKVERRGAVKV